MHLDTQCRGKVDHVEDLEREKNSNLLSGLPKEHPFARICCVARKAFFTECNGTCDGCHRRRQEFEIIEPHHMRSNEIIHAGGDPEIEIPEIDFYKKELDSKIADWKSRKTVIIAKLNKEKELQAFTDNKMRYLETIAGLGERIMDQAPMIQ